MMSESIIKPKGLSIFCPICGASFIPLETQTNICLSCLSSQSNIAGGIVKEGIICQCRNCRRYQRPPWVYCERESKELLALCLKKIKGLQGLKIIDAGFIWTEPHSRRIKVKLTVQKEVVRNVEVQESFVVEFTEYFQ
jgi:nonsense-mediated mRNA decay protein 3